MAEPIPEWERSNLRPRWLADDQAWRDHLQAMDTDEIRWIERHWDLAGGGDPDLDLSWVTTETIGDPGWPVVVAGVVMVAALVGVALAVVMLVALAVVAVHG